MGRVQLSSQGWSPIVDSSGNGRAAVAFTLTTAAGGTVPIYSAASGATTLLTAAKVTSARGVVPGYAEEGTYTLTVEGVATTVEVVSGGPGGVVYAASYGATGDGTTDDTAAITAAFNATPPGVVASDVTNAVTVVLGPGTYVVSGLAFTARGQTLKGSGWATTLKAKAGATYAVKCEGHSRCALESLSIDGNGRASSGVLVQATASQASEQFSMSRVRVANALIGLHIGPGAAITQVDKNLFTLCHFSANTTAVKIDSTNGQEQVFDGADIYNGQPFASAIGIDLVNGSLTLRGSQLQTAGATGIKFSGSTIEWVSLEDSIFEGHTRDVDGNSFWPRNGLYARQCAFQGATNTVRCAVNNAVFVAELVRFNNGAATFTGTDQVFFERYTEYASGGTKVSSGATQFRNPQFSANGLSAVEVATQAITTGRTPLIAKALVSQTGDLIQAQDSNGTPVFRVGATGIPVLPVLASPVTDATITGLGQTARDGMMVLGTDFKWYVRIDGAWKASAAMT